MAEWLGIPPACVATHSYRSGGASTYAAHGVPAYIIKKMGRWASDAWIGYVRCDVTLAGFVSAALKCSVNSEEAFMYDQSFDFHGSTDPDALAELTAINQWVVDK